MAALALLSAAPASAHPQQQLHVDQHPAKTVKRWERQHRWRAKYKPYVYPDGSHWSAPYPVVWCESGPGGDYDIGPAGAYGEIMAPAWQTPREQDEEAYRLVHTVGVYQAWRKWEIEQGCLY